MKNLMIAAAVAAALSHLPAGADAAAASADEIAQIRQQLQGLMQRVDKLEQENAALKVENESLKASDEDLKAQSDYLRAEAKGLRKDAASQAADASKIKGADWASRISAKGDLRYRHEQIDDPTRKGASGLNDEDQLRHRIRLRFGFDAKVTDSLIVGLQLATGGDDPRSANQTLGSVFTRKPFQLDLAYFDWKFASWGDLIGGKMKYPYFKPGQSLFFDNDVNPEGLALTFNRGVMFGSAYGWWVDERNNAAASTATTLTNCVAPAGRTCSDDIYIVGGQIGARFPIGASNLVAAVHYQDLVNGKGQRPFYNASSGSSSNGNTVVIFPGMVAPGLANEFQVWEGSVEFNTVIGALPLQIWGDYAQNQGADNRNTAWTSGFLFGKASNYRTWEFGALYEVMEKDAIFGQLVDSDFADGTTDSEGWVFRAGYAPVKNVALNATYYLNKRNVDVPNGIFGTKTDYDRVQLDFNMKF